MRDWFVVGADHYAGEHAGAFRVRKSESRMSAEQRSADQRGKNNQKIAKTFHRFASVSTFSLYFRGALPRDAWNEFVLHENLSLGTGEGEACRIEVACTGRFALSCIPRKYRCSELFAWHSCFVDLLRCQVFRKPCEAHRRRIWTANLLIRSGRPPESWWYCFLFAPIAPFRIATHRQFASCMKNSRAKQTFGWSTLMPANLPAGFERMMNNSIFRFLR